MFKKKVYGVGYNSGDTYPVMSSPNIKSKAYSIWKDMLRRGYSETYKDKRETYRNVNVCDQWHDYQVFAEWFYNNYKEGFQLDKDMVKKDNLTYCPEYCRFIPRDLNSIVVNRIGKARNNELPLGVSYSNVKSKPFCAWCNNGSGKTVNLGSYVTVEEAKNAYIVYKKNLITEKAELYYKKGDIDEEVYKSLLNWEVD